MLGSLKPLYDSNKLFINENILQQTCWENLCRSMVTDETYNKLTAQEKNYVMLRKPYTTFPMDSLYGFGLIFKSEEFPHPESKEIK